MVTLISKGIVEKIGPYRVRNEKPWPFFIVKNLDSFEKLSSDHDQMLRVLRSNHGKFSVDIFGTLYYGDFNLKEFTNIPVEKIDNFEDDLLFSDNDGNIWYYIFSIDTHNKLCKTTDLIAPNINPISLCIRNSGTYFYIDKHNKLFMISFSNGDVEINEIDIPKKIKSIQYYFGKLYAIDIYGDIWVSKIPIFCTPVDFLEEYSFKRISVNHQFTLVLFTGYMKYAVDCLGHLWAKSGKSWTCILSIRFITQIAFSYDKVQILDINGFLWEFKNFTKNEKFSNELTLLKSGVDYLGGGTEKYIPKISKWH